MAADGGLVEIEAARSRCRTIRARRSATARRAIPFTVEGPRVGLDVIADDCQPRQMILDRSRWLPPGTETAAARTADRANRGHCEDAARRAAMRRGRLAVVPRARSLRRQRQAEPARHVESGDRREHPVAHADSRTRALEPDRLGRHALRHQRDQQPRQRDVQAGSLRRRRCIRRSLASSLDALRDRQAHRQDPLGAHRGAGRAAQQAAHQVHLRQRLARHRRPHRRRVVRIAGHLRLRRRRRPALVGRSRPRRHGRLRHSRPTNGDRRARRSSGTAW